jgi:hypothetical protein
VILSSSAYKYQRRNQQKGRTIFREREERTGGEILEKEREAETEGKKQKLGGKTILEKERIITEGRTGGFEKRKE